MEQRQSPPLRNPSRTVAKIAVAVLIVIAIGGVVLTAVRQRNPAGDPAAGGGATQEGAPALTAAASGAQASAADDAAGPNGLVFAPASDQLSQTSRAKLLRLAETARKEHRTVSIAAKVEARADRAERMALARNRSVAVRQVLEANGIPLGSMRIEIAELPPGLVSPAEANKVELVLH